MNNFSLNLIFSKTDSAKIILLIILFSHTYISITLKNKFAKERKIYEHVWTYFIYNYVCL